MLFTGTLHRPDLGTEMPVRLIRIASINWQNCLMSRVWRCSFFLVLCHIIFFRLSIEDSRLPASCSSCPTSTEQHGELGHGERTPFSLPPGVPLAVSLIGGRRRSRRPRPTASEANRAATGPPPASGEEDAPVAPAAPGGERRRTSDSRRVGYGS